jgi:pimeloyl-ACP methyl ester carboxylesterase
VLRFVTDDDVALHVEIAGADDSPTAVLAHGLAGPVASSWRATGAIDRLVGSGLRVVAYDARGHGESDAPHDPARYGDDRLVADLIAITDRYAGKRAVIAGYSMGAATALLALSRGWDVAGAVIGGAPTAVLAWTEGDEKLRTDAVVVLEGSQPPDPGMQLWLDFLDSIGADRAALAALLRGHQPVVRDWERITVPVVVAAGADDVTAAPVAEVAARLAHGRALELPGDHVAALAAPAFTDAIAALVSA